MIRPDHLIQYFQIRVRHRQTDWPQVLNGVTAGGLVVVGGEEPQAQAMRTMMTLNRRLGKVKSSAELMPTDLRLDLTVTFDLAAVTQLVMLAKNDSFHRTVDQCLTLLQKVCVEDGHPIETGLQLLREQADEVGRL